MRVRRIVVGAAATVALSVAAVGLTAGPASAQMRNACQDAANLRTAGFIALGDVHQALGEVLFAGGQYSQAQNEFGLASGFYAAAQIEANTANC